MTQRSMNLKLSETGLRDPACAGFGFKPGRQLPGITTVDRLPWQSWPQLKCR